MSATRRNPVETFLFVELLTHDMRRLSMRTFGRAAAVSVTGLNHSCVEIPEWLGTGLFMEIKPDPSIGLPD